MPTLTVLLNAWVSGATRFRSLSDDEWMAWRGAYERGENPRGVVTVNDAPTSATPPPPPQDIAMTVLGPSALARSGASAPTPTAPTPTAPAPAPASAPAPSPTPSLAPSRASTPAPSVLASTPAPSHASTPAPTQLTFLHAIGREDGTGIVVPQKQRKERKDKGVKRGPRAKKGDDGAPPVSEPPPTPSSSSGASAAPGATPPPIS